MPHTAAALAAQRRSAPRSRKNYPALLTQSPQTGEDGSISRLKKEMIERCSQKTRGPFISCLSEGGKPTVATATDTQLPHKKKQQLLVAKEVVARRCVLAGSVLLKTGFLHLQQQCDLQSIPLRPRRDPDEHDRTRI